MIYVFLLHLLFGIVSYPADYEASYRGVHDIHMSRCDIDYNEESKSLEISIRIFIDDLELDLKGGGYDSLKLCTEHEKEGAEELVYKYITDHLIIDVDDRKVPMQWIGKEISEDLSAVWCYLEVEDIDPKLSMTITNDVLVSLYEDQQNIVKVVMGEGERSFFLFTHKQRSGSIEFE